MTNQTEVICSYGCGKTANHTLKNGKPCCSQYAMQCEAVKLKNKEGLKKAYAKGTRKFVYANLSDEVKDRMAWSKGLNVLTDERVRSKTNIDKIFIPNSKVSPHMVRQLIIKNNLIDYRCIKCELVDEWKGEPISLQLDHINGIGNDNRLDNLRFLCPNCHSQTETFQGKNIGKKHSDCVTEIELIEAIKNNNNIRQTLLQLGLVAKGGNYATVYNCMAKHSLKFKEK